MGEEPSSLKIEELFFDEYYRMLVLEDLNRFIISVDVYKPGWDYTNYKDVCINETCLLLKELSPSEINLDAAMGGVEKVVVVGVKVGAKFETIGVKWFMKHKPSSEEVRSIYERSWRIIRQ
ncbi:MAG: hypothetical protein QXW94_03195 [Desulfurococcaceae archaeon]